MKHYTTSSHQTRAKQHGLHQDKRSTAASTHQPRQRLAAGKIGQVSQTDPTDTTDNGMETGRNSRMAGGKGTRQPGDGARQGGMIAQNEKARQADNLAGF
jgi:hypothetical protein